MLSKWFLGLSASLLLIGLVGCMGESDPVAAGTKEFTVEPSAAQGYEAAVKAEQEREKKQAEMDKSRRKSGGR